ncbi:MAG: efflux RND transporter periplasmic adaptor subunit [Verrucomicrobiota bacterium]
MRTFPPLSSLPLSTILLAACGGGEQAGGPPPGDFPVQIAHPIVKSVTLTEVYTGRFVPCEEVELRARVSGYLESVHFEEGQKVKKGDLMFQIDPRPFDAMVDAASAEVKQAEARLELAEANMRRVASLADTGAISEEETDIRGSEVTQAQADLLAANAQLAAVSLDREFADVEAPISGIADRFEVTPGNFITGGGIGATMLTTIVPHDPIHCVFEVDERTILEFTRMYFDNLAPGRSGEPLEAEVAVSDSEEYEFSGTIDFSENQLDAETATAQLRVLVENDDEFLTPGLFAKVRLTAGKPFDATLVRDSALGFDQSMRFAWVLQEDGSVKRSFVEVGRLDGEFRIITSGLEQGAKIVVSGIQLLQDGMKVAPTEVPMDRSLLEESTSVEEPETKGVAEPAPAE